MKKFNYCRFVINPINETVRILSNNFPKQFHSLNELGEDGWEIVGYCTIVTGSGCSSDGDGYCSIKSDGYWLAKKEVEE